MYTTNPLNKRWNSGYIHVRLYFVCWDFALDRLAFPEHLGSIWVQPHFCSVLSTIGLSFCPSYPLYYLFLLDLWLLITFLYRSLNFSFQKLIIRYSKIHVTVLYFINLFFLLVFIVLSVLRPFTALVSSRKVWRYQRGVIRIRISKKNRQHNGHKIPKGGHQNPYIEEEQTTQWPQDTKGG